MNRSIKWKPKVTMIAYLNLTLAMAISGSAVVVNKIMVNTIPTFLATELGIVIGMLILIPMTFIYRKERCHLDKKTYVILFLQAFLGIVMYRIFTFCGLMYTSAANSGLITSASPAMVVLLAAIMLREKIGKKEIIGVVIVISGLFTIHFASYLEYVKAGHGINSLKGNMLIFVAVICEALFSVLSKIKCRPMSALYRTTMIVMFAAICLCPMAVYDIIHYNVDAIPMKTVACIIYYGIFVTYLSYVFWFQGIAKVPASEAAIFTSVVPISSIILSVLILKETIQLSHMIGLSCILTGIFMTCIQQKK